MLTVTDTAGAHLVDLLGKASKPDDMVVRIERGDSGNLTLRFAYALPDDTTFEHQDRTVLAYDSQIASTLDGTKLDMQDQGDGPQLVVRRPDNGE